MAAILARWGGLAAIAAAANFQRLGRRPSRMRRLRLGAALAAFAFGFAQIPALVATERVRDSDRLLAAGEAVAAREQASQAIQAEPWAATPRAQRALSEESLGELAAARNDLLDARDREPTNWRWPAQAGSAPA